jgi:GntR family phosphonate transport system transcriptional regulator
MTLADEITGVALWRRVADSIERGIADGLYARGAKLPGEMEIADTYKVNRHTVRRALAALAERGLVRAERGSGTYVDAPRLAYPLRARTRFSEIVGGVGREASGELIGSAIEPSTREIASRLNVRAGTMVLRIDALRLADKMPLSAGTTFLVADRFVNGARIYERTRSMTRMLAHYGIRDYSRSWTRITAAIADMADTGRLKLAAGQPVLVTDSLDVDADGAPLLTTRARFAAERMQFVIDNR